MTHLLITPLKIGIAAACLIGVAILIAVDLGNSKASRDTGPGAPSSLPAPPPVLPMAPASSTEHAVLCPELAPAVTEPKEPTKSSQAPAKEARVTLDPAVTASSVVAEKKVEPLSAPPLTYTVVQGDSLYGISVKVFGTPRHYERIYELNRDRIRDPNTLQVGINLKLPDVAKAAASPIGTSPAPSLDGAR